MKAVCFTASDKTNKDNFLFSPAIKIDPIAPIPAASVGEATPKIIDPKTEKISKKGGIKIFNICFKEIEALVSLKLIFLFEIFKIK